MCAVFLGDRTGATGQVLRVRRQCMLETDQVQLAWYPGYVNSVGLGVRDMFFLRVLLGSNARLICSE